MTSRHICYLVCVLFTAFLIQSNESLVPIWGTRCINSQAASGNIRCMPTSFFRPQKSSTAIGSSNKNEGPEASAYFFADKDMDSSDAMDDEAAEELKAAAAAAKAAEEAKAAAAAAKAAEEEKAAAAKAAAEEKAAQERAAEQARLDKIAQQAKLEEEVRLADEKREKMIKEWTDKTVESVEKVIVSKFERHLLWRTARLFASSYGFLWNCVIIPCRLLLLFNFSQKKSFLILSVFLETAIRNTGWSSSGANQRGCTRGNSPHILGQQRSYCL